MQVARVGEGHEELQLEGEATLLRGARRRLRRARLLAGDGRRHRARRARPRAESGWRGVTSSRKKNFHRIVYIKMVALSSLDERRESRQLGAHCGVVLVQLSCMCEPQPFILSCTPATAELSHRKAVAIHGGLLGSPPGGSRVRQRFPHRVHRLPRLARGRTKRRRRRRPISRIVWLAAICRGGRPADSTAGGPAQRGRRGAPVDPRSDR